MSETYGKENLPVFDERVRRESPVSSYKRADEFDRSVTLTKDMLKVLNVIDYMAGQTARELGRIMAELYDFGYYETPHKVMSRMEQAGWVRREMPANERAYKCYITDKGKAVLNR